jgi:hypothetical protein
VQGDLPTTDLLGHREAAFVFVHCIAALVSVVALQVVRPSFSSAIFMSSSKPWLKDTYTRRSPVKFVQRFQRIGKKDVRPSCRPRWHARDRRRLNIVRLLPQGQHIAYKPCSDAAKP